MSSCTIPITWSTLALGAMAIVLFILVSTFVMGRLLDKKIGDIRVNVPKINVQPPNVVVRMSGGGMSGSQETTCVQEAPPQKPPKLSHPNAVQLHESFLNVKFDDPKKNEPKTASIEDELGCKPIVVNTSTPPTNPRITVGCTKDADCNIVNGDGKNVCKSDGTCSCIGGGSGQFCHYGPVNYRDPKDMNEAERRRFKSQYRTDMTLQDYKNWLMLYREDPDDLRAEHRNNLRVLLQGGQLNMKDIPAISVKAPTDAADYFQQMYKDGNVAVIFPENEGPYVGANYGQFDGFEPPEYVSNAITGVVNAHTSNTKDNAFATDWYMRPIVTVGQDEQRAGDIYRKYSSQQEYLADMRESAQKCSTPKNGCKDSPISGAVFSGEFNLKTFQSGDVNADKHM